MRAAVRSWQRSPLLLALAVPLLAGSAFSLQDDVWTPHRVATMRGVGDAVISPDGTRIAYTLAVPRIPSKDEDGTAWRELHVMDPATGISLPYVTGEVSVGAIDWTPDGSAISFLAKRNKDKTTSLYVLPLRGGEARRALSMETDLSAYAWSPDGKRVAVLAAAPEAEAVKKAKEKGFKQEIYEEDWRPTKVWIGMPFDDDAKPRDLGVEGHASALRWSPSGDRIAVALAPTALVDDSYVSQRVRIVDAESGKVLVRIENPGKLGSFDWSPDGSALAVIAAADENDTVAGRLHFVPANDGKLLELMRGMEGDVGAATWIAKDRILFLGDTGTATTLSTFSTNFDEERRGSLRKDLVSAAAPVFTSLSASRDGKRVALVGSAPHHGPELLFWAEGDTQARRLTHSNPQLEKLRLAKQEVVRYEARDGMQIEGLLIRPLDETPGVRVPLIVVVHGGPEAHMSNGWLTAYSMPGQVAAAKGYAVFYPNYRGSTGRGIAFAKSSQGDPAGKEFDDLVDGVDHLIATGLVDGAKVGITGGSYGGYATAWCSTRYTDRFAAGVMFVGISNKISKVGTTDIANEEFLVHARKRPWDDWQFFLERSPIFHAKDARTPLLILHGKDDPRVDPGQSREIYRHLKLHGKAPVRLVHYPGEGHGNRKAAARLDYSLRMQQWFDHYLLGQGGAPPGFEIDHADPAAAKKSAEPASARKSDEKAGSGN